MQRVKLYFQLNTKVNVNILLKLGKRKLKEGVESLKFQSFETRR